jgi:predicted acylesterase/phospholipase RssA
MHLVISGGGQTILQALGVLQHLEINNKIQRENIKTIYGTSAGAMVGVLFAFNFDWETINDFMIKRPWHDVFPIKVQNIFDAYTNKGIFNEKVFEKILKPLLDAKDLSLDITLKEFYDYSKIEVHFFSFEINEFILEDISYLTHPDLKLLMVLQMTCGIPVLVSPICIEKKCYIDGGMISNYPLNFCIDKFPDVEEILGIKNKYDNVSKNEIDEKSNLLDFIMNFLFKIIYSFSTSNKQPKIPNEVVYKASVMNINTLKQAIHSIDVRKELLESGIEAAKEYINKT